MEGFNPGGTIRKGVSRVVWLLHAEGDEFGQGRRSGDETFLGINWRASTGQADEQGERSCSSRNNRRKPFREILILGLSLLYAATNINHFSFRYRSIGGTVALAT
jgi:hypothetical protein